jgi:iron complex outermembrane receptor protein
MKYITIGGIVSTAVALVAMHVPLVAFAEEQRVLEEIIVTATKSESSLQDTSIAVSAFDSDMMEDMNITSGMDYEALVPSLSIQLSPNRTSIRGVGRFSNSLGIAPGVAMYEDGGYNQENTALGVDPMNTERVEILRGPQGTLFGRNTTGGATNIISKRPTDELFFETRASAGNYGNKNAKFLISGPITDTIRGKLYHSAWWADGIRENRNGEQISGTRDDDGNSYTQWMFDWQATDNLYIMYKGGSLSTSYYGGGGTSFTPYDPHNVCTSALGAWCAPYQQVQAGIERPTGTWDVDINEAGRTGLDNHLQTTFHVIYDFEEVQMKYISYHNHYDWYSYGMDFDGTSHPTIRQTEEIEQFQRVQTHELTFTSTSDSPLQWIAGAYLFEDKNWQPYYLLDTNPDMVNVLDDGSYTGTVWWGHLYYVPIPESDIIDQNPMLCLYCQTGYLENDNWSVFGEINYEINDKWKVTVGARYSVDDLKGTETQIQYGDSDAYVDENAHQAVCDYYGLTDTCITRGALDFSGTKSRVSENDYSDTSGRIIIDYTPDENNLYWFTISNAFKVGGINLGSMQGASYGVTPFFDGEEVTMYELGWKGSPSDTINLEVIGFYYDYSDMQQLRGYRTDFGIPLDDVINVDAEMYGIELTATWLATNNLILYSTYSYNHAEFAEDVWVREGTMLNDCDTVNVYGDCMHNLDGNKLDITPDHKFALNAMYTTYASIGEIQLGGTYSYVGERYMDIFNREETRGRSYTRLDLHASWRSNDEHWKIEASAKNALDEEWFNTRSVGVNANEPLRYDFTRYLSFSGIPANPRLWTVEFQYNL